MTLTFTVLGVAAPQGSLVPVVSKSTGRTFVKQSCARTMPWRQEVAAVAAEAVKRSPFSWPTCEAVFLRATFYLPRPKSHFTPKGALKLKAPRFPTKKPDLSKLDRALEDALTGIVYRDDAQIVWEDIRKQYADESLGPPRAVVTVERMEYPQ